MISQVRDAGNKRHPARVAVIISVNKKTAKWYTVLQVCRAD